MAHFAQLDENNKVIQVIVVRNIDIIDADGNESEQVGIEFCKSLYGADTRWIQTSYTASFRKHFASTDMRYDSTIDEFVIEAEFLA